MKKNKWFLNGGRGSGQTYRRLFEYYENKVANLEKENAELKADYEVLSCSVGDFGELQDKLEEEQRKNNGLEEKISVLLSCKNCPEKKGGYICVKEYENKCLAQKIQYIKELKEENAELKKVKQVKIEVTRDYKKLAKDLQEQGNQLTKAKELLRQLVNIEYAVNIPKDKIISLRVKAEQFLNSEEEK